MYANYKLDEDEPGGVVLQGNGSMAAHNSKQLSGAEYLRRVKRMQATTSQQSCSGSL